MWPICQNFCLKPNFHLPFWKFGKRHHGPPQPAKQVFACLAHKMSCVDGFWPDLAESRVLDPNIFLTNFQLSINKTVRTVGVFPFLDLIFWHFQPFLKLRCTTVTQDLPNMVSAHNNFFEVRPSHSCTLATPHWPPAVPHPATGRPAMHPLTQKPCISCLVWLILTAPA